PRGADDLWRVPAPGPPAVGAASALGSAAPRRDAVHRPAPGFGAVAEDGDPLAVGGARVPAPRPGVALPEGDRALQAGAAPAYRAVVGAGDAHALGIHGVPRRARAVVGLPVAAVPHARVPDGQQECGDAQGVRPRPGGAGAPARGAGRARPVRRAADVPLSLGPRGAAAAPGPRLDPAARARRGLAAGARGRLRAHRPLLARVRAVRGPGGPGDPVPAVALPAHAHGDADHRLQARHRRVLGGGFPQAGAGADLLPRAVRRAHAHRPGALTRAADG